MLGILPTELVQLVLRHCDTSTFLQAACSCRTLLEIASSSRDLLLHQLTQTPGWNDGIEELSRRAAFKLLLERSHQQLFGAEFYVKATAFDYGGRRVDTRASSLHTLESRVLALLTFQVDSFVGLCEVKDGSLNHLLQLYPPGTPYGETEILQTAIASDCVWMLHRFKPFIDQDLDTDHPFVKQALQSNAQGSVFLARYDLHHWNEVTRTRLYGFPEQSGYEPLAFAVDGQRFAISWQHLQRSDDHQVVLYSTIEDDDTHDDTDNEEDKEGAAKLSKAQKAEEMPVVGWLYPPGVGFSVLILIRIALQIISLD